ncbi:hypothetical protein C0991_003342 [Blastosporella zonata]|nr:hypothetical protein C0991_003342 [Blastosporella zonata]
MTARLPLPPGPQGYFFSGVKHLLGTTEPWKLYDIWAHHFTSGTSLSIPTLNTDPNFAHFLGSIISFRVYNRQIVVLNDASAVYELLEKRANIYSDRPNSPMFNDVCGRGKAIFNISSLDQRHKQYRRLLNTGLNARATQQYWPLLQSELDILLNGNAAAVIMKMAYGYTVTADDHFTKVAEEGSRISGLATAPGKWLVDYYPIIRFIPSFFPGTGWKRQGEEWRQRLNTLSGVPHAWVKEQMVTGNFTESFTSRLLRPNGVDMVDAEQEDIIKWCAGGLYAGAGDTTVSALLSFVMLLALYPSVQAKAQAELDALTGQRGALHPSELNSLVYLPAVMKEVLRYAPVANLALPHRVTQEDEYQGYRIPKNATVMANVWSILHNADLYPEPYNFDPERFTSFDKNGQPDPRVYVFGFGRRTCPGMNFAETTMLLAMAGILSEFNISLPSGKPRPEVQFTSGITSHIKPLDVIIAPRFKAF